MNGIKQVKLARKDYLAQLKKVRASKSRWNNIALSAALEAKTLKEAMELARIAPWCLEHRSSGKISAMYKWIEFSSSIEELLQVMSIAVSSMAKKNKFDLSRIWTKWDELSAEEVAKASTSDQLMNAFRRCRVHSPVIEKLIRKLVSLTSDKEGIERIKLLLKESEPNNLGNRLTSAITKVNALEILADITKNE